MPEISAELQQRFQEEMEELRQKPVQPVYMDPLMLWIVVSGLQLALRHPLNTGPSAVIQRSFIEQVRDLIAPPGSAMAVVFELGFDPEYDHVEVSKP